jgi:anti-sigma regulatory factor (Ser/Thr protein kinase)
MQIPVRLFGVRSPGTFVNPITWPVLASVPFIAIIGGYLNIVVRLGQSPGFAGQRVMTSMLVALLCLYLLREILWVPYRDQVRKVIWISGLLVTAFLTPTVPMVMMNPGDETFEEVLQFSLTPGFAVFLLILLISSQTATTERNRIIRSELLSRNAELQQLKAGAETALLDATDRMLVEIHDALDGPLNNLQMEVDDIHVANDSEHRHAAQALVEFISTIVRPLSHRINTYPTPAHTFNPVSVAPGQEPQRMKQPISAPLLIQPGLATLAIVGLAATAMLTRDFPPASFALRIATALLALPMLYFAKRCWPPRWALLPTWAAYLAGFTLYLIVATLTRGLYQVSAQVFGLPTSPPNATPLFLFLSLVLATLALSLKIGDAQRLNTLTALRSANLEIQIHNSRLRQELWFLKKRYSWFLHGPIQSLLLSAAVQLSSRPVTEANLDYVKETITEAQRLLDCDPLHQSDLREVLTQCRDLWVRNCAIQFELPEDLEHRLRESLNTALAVGVAEVSREAIGNAVRHGNATNIDLQFALDDHDIIHVEISNNGAAIPDDASPGLGSELLDDVCLDWERKTDGDITTLHAMFTFALLDEDLPGSDARALLAPANTGEGVLQNVR